MPKIKNMGTATMRFKEGVIITGSAGSDAHSLVVTGSSKVIGDITCNNINIGADAAGTGRTISAGNTDTSLRFNATDGVDIVVGGSFFISCDENASQDTIVVNTSGHDIDFRIESDNKEYQLFSDAGNDLLILGSDVEMPSGVGSDTNVIISGSADGQGQVVFTGNVVASGSLSTESDLIIDGRIGIGTDSPAYKLEVGGSMAVGQYIYHRNDANTFINFTDDRIRLNAGNLNFIDCENAGSAPHKVKINNGGNNIDLIIKDNSGNIYLRADADTSNLGVGTETPLTKLDVHHNPTGLANDTGGGEVVNFGSGTLTTGKLYYLNTSSTWTEVDADAVASGADQLLGIALGSSPSSDGVLIRGFFDAHSYLSNFSAGKAVYISTTAGGMDTTAPSGAGDFVRVVGYCTATSNVIYFNPSSAWVEL